MKRTIENNVKMRSEKCKELEELRGTIRKSYDGLVFISDSSYYKMRMKWIRELERKADKLSKGLGLTFNRRQHRTFSEECKRHMEGIFEMHEMHVYLITNLINGIQYVGRAMKYNSEYLGSGKLIAKAVKKFGRENFRKEILIGDEDIDSWEECAEIEAACILSLRTLAPNGYNKIWWNWPLPPEIGRIIAKRNQENGKAIFAPGMQRKGGKRTYELHAEEMKEWRRKAGKIGGKMSVHILFETDGLVQRMTLGTMLKM